MQGRRDFNRVLFNDVPLLTLSPTPSHFSIVTEAGPNQHQTGSERTLTEPRIGAPQMPSCVVAHSQMFMKMLLR